MTASYKGEVGILPGKAAWDLSIESLKMKGNFEVHHAYNKETMAILIEFIGMIKGFYIIKWIYIYTYVTWL